MFGYDVNELSIVVQHVSNRGLSVLGIVVNIYKPQTPLARFHCGVTHQPPFLEKIRLSMPRDGEEMPLGESFDFHRGVIYGLPEVQEEFSLVQFVRLVENSDIGAASPLGFAVNRWVAANKV